MLHDIQAWLGTLAVANLVRDSVATKALLESAHILGNALIIFAMGMVTLRLMGLSGRSQSIVAMVQRFTPWVWGGLIVVFVTGLVLLTGAGRRGLDNPMFEIKLVTMALAIALTAAIQAALQRDTAFWELTPARRVSIKVLAPLAFLLWLATIFAGRWLAYSSTFFVPTY